MKYKCNTYLHSCRSVLLPYLQELILSLFDSTNFVFCCFVLLSATNGYSCPVLSCPVLLCHVLSCPKKRLQYCTRIYTADVAWQSERQAKPMTNVPSVCRGTRLLAVHAPRAKGQWVHGHARHEPPARRKLATPYIYGGKAEASLPRTENILQVPL